ncbi:hypothetical protein [Embleya sp. NBC_00896]|uniref:hypothetical protein n=1 Tax=Embleya sp. NBC_00896 TaxID=2975961 RepID=UPI00386F3F32|nr:hypothetical protein OG928_12690 [Embleya sp. NBC_00896]
MNTDEVAPWFVLPDGFEVLPMDRDPIERATELVLMLQDFWPEATPEQRIQCALTNDAFLDGLNHEGVVHLSTCLARKDDGALTSAMLVVTVKYFEPKPGVPFADRVVRELGPPSFDRDIAVAPSALGRIPVVVEDSTPRVPGELVGADEDFGVTTRYVRAFFPFPGQSRMAVFTLSTQDLDTWPDYVEMMAAICASVSFAPPAVAGRVAGALDGGPPVDAPREARRSRIADVFD